MTNSVLHPANIAVFFAYLVGMVAMGVFFSRRNSSSDDYFRGGGKLPWWAVSLSIYATMFSSITFLSIPAMVYHTDMRYVSLSLGILLLAPIVVKWYLPFFRRLNLTSAYEYLEVRFNLACRLFASAAFIMFMIARTAVVTYLPAVALSAVVGIDVNWAIVVVIAVTIFYCTLGGVEAVVWSDFVQSVILIGGTLLMFVFLILGTDGGISGFIAKGMEGGKFRVFDFAFDWSQPCFWVVFVGGIVANNASGMCCGTHANSDKLLRSVRMVLVDGSVLDTGDEASREAFRKSHPSFLQELTALKDRVLSDRALSERIHKKYSIKNVTGLNLRPLVAFDDVFDMMAHLLVGSEGTLAFISEV